MKLPFTSEDFLKVFEMYNQAIFPVQIVFNLLALLAIYAIVVGKQWTDKVVCAFLSFLWIWMGIMYHIVFFTAINKAAYLFGTLFIVEGCLILWQGVFRNKLSFHLSKNTYGILGFFLMLFALLIYPVLSYSLGHVYPANPTFGLPCPTTIFTFGVFLTTRKRIPMITLLIPILWALIGFSAAFSLGIKEDIALLLSGLIAFRLLIKRNKEIEG
jgi:hypothetical protein